MKQWIYLGVILAALIAGGTFGFKWLFPSPERVIRNRLIEAQELCNFGPNEGPLAKSLNSQQLASFFTADAQVIVDFQGFSAVAMQGRERILQHAMAVRTQVQSMEVSLVDIIVHLGPDKRTATVNLTARANMRGQQDYMVQEFELELVKSGRDWLIRKVLTVRTLN